MYTPRGKGGNENDYTQIMFYKHAVLLVIIKIQIKYKYYIHISQI